MVNRVYCGDVSRSYRRGDVNKVLGQRLVRVLEANDSRSRFMATMFDEHRVCGRHQHWTILAVVTGVEGDAEHETIRFDRMLVDGTFEPRRVDSFGVQVSEVPTKLSRIWFGKSQSTLLTALVIPASDLCGLSTSISPSVLRWMKFWHQTSDSLAWEGTKRKALESFGLTCWKFQCVLNS